MIKIKYTIKIINNIINAMFSLKIISVYRVTRIVYIYHTFLYISTPSRICIYYKIYIEIFIGWQTVSARIIFYTQWFIIELKFNISITVINFITIIFYASQRKTERSSVTYLVVFVLYFSVKIFLTWVYYM